MHRAPEASALTRGTTLAVTQQVAVVGRAPDTDVVLSDPTVSRRHLRVDVGPPLRVTALTDTNGTFLDGAPLPVGEAVPVPSEETRLQLGGVVITLVPLGETEPVREPLVPSLDASEPVPLLEIRWDAGQCLVRCAGRDLGLTGAAARFLGLLAEQPGQVVHHWDLQQELNTPHLAPLATTARNALATAAQSGVVDLQLLRARIRAAAVSNDDPDPEDPTAVMRALIQSRRGHGYVLHLIATDVVVERV